MGGNNNESLRVSSTGAMGEGDLPKKFNFMPF